MLPDQLMKGQNPLRAARMTILYIAALGQDPDADLSTFPWFYKCERCCGFLCMHAL